eukprot:TRINITY_DN3151_c0_g1_i1.p1 TRINITY_DN3151_c0_g1~~TRINITY_DN3151_c0_g1_i1.p1  ORF type:complete len:731 (+),score=263.16 TRINITY_DN3151_c0_g1_i1:56-2248(+)
MSLEFIELGIYKTKEPKIKNLVEIFGKKLERPQKDINDVIQLLNDNWIVRLSDWKNLSEKSKASLGIPVMLVEQLENFISSFGDEWDFCYLSKGSSNSYLSLTIDKVSFKLSYEDTLEKLLEMIDKEFEENSCLYTEAENKIHQDTKLVYCLTPGNMFTIGSKCFVIKSGFPMIAVHSWLKSLGMEKYSILFSQHDIEDFFTLPFLKREILEEMTIKDKADLNIITSAIEQLRKYTPEEFVSNWLIFFGLENHVEIFMEKQINLQNLRFLREKEFESMGIQGEERTKLMQFIEKYKGFSSVEETFLWLRNNGFEKYSFHFARYNIPFYALPFVNFFIIDEMGVTQDDQVLLTALQNLKKTPNYKVKAISYWLRDLEMEKYNITFVNKNLTDLESLTILTDKAVDKLITDTSDRNKMKTGIQEMKEFQFYYSATASLLQELGMERYSQLFSLHGISIDVLPFLNENLLIEMGITEVSDRKKILNAINKIKHEIPLNHNFDSSSSSSSIKSKLNFSSQKESTSSSKSGKDNYESRSVKELLSFINQNQSKNNNKHSSDNNNFLHQTKPSKSPNNNGETKSRSPNKDTPLNGNHSSESKNGNTNGKNSLPTKSTQPLSPIPNNSPSSSSTEKRKNRKKKKKNNKTVPSSPKSNDVSELIQKQKVIPSPLSNKKQTSQHNKDDLQFEEDLSDDDLDPELKRQLDREVEEFRRRLENVNSHGTKSKLAPIYYLPN